MPESPSASGSLDLWLIDAFTDRAFAGNPAAICLLPEARPERWMQDVAREMNQAETAFLVRGGDGYGLRWFTPAAEVKLCGHATLASAHFLWERHDAEEGRVIRFHTKSGVLTAEREGDWIVLDFPATPASPVEPPAGLLESLGDVAGADVLGNGMDYMVILAEAKTVRSLEPDMRRLAGVDCRGVIVTAAGDRPGIDFVSRFFGPAVGVDEDPVTGSAHCTLGPYWGSRLGKTELTGHQASPRGGSVRVTLAGDRVRLAGRAVTVLRGALAA